MAQYQDQIMEWLGGAYSPPGQDPLQIFTEINSFETDFSNGYLFGTILTHYGICDTINTFAKKSNKEAQVHNFYQIEEALRRLKVTFDAKLIHKVMNEEPGASLHLLNLLKRALDRHFTKSDLTVTNLKRSVLDSKVKHTRDLAMKLPSIHKEFGVDGPTIKSKHYQNVEQKLLKFEVARANFEKKAQNDEMAERSMLQSIQQQKRQEALLKMQENKQFMKEWNETGYNNWKVNQERRAHEIARGKYFEDREVKIYKDSLSKELNYNTQDMKVGISEFHENMRKLGIEENITIQEAVKRQEQKKGIPPGQIQNFSYAATMNKIKDTKINNEFAGKERERRNRKLKVDQQKIQEMLDSQKKEETILQKLLAKQSQQQKEAFNRERAVKCKGIETDIRVRKAQEFKSKREHETAQIEQKLKDEAEAIEPERQEQFVETKREYKQVRREEKSKRRRVNVEIASEIVDLILDMTDCAHEFLQEKQAEPDAEDRLLNKPTWREWMSIFTEGKKVSEANIVIQEDQGLQKVESEKSPLAKMLGVGIDSITPSQILDKVKNEQIYSEFLQYLTVSGSMNMQLFANKEWNNLAQVAQTDQQIKDRNLDLSFLNDNSIPLNTELAKYLEKLYAQIQKSKTTLTIDGSKNIVTSQSQLNMNKTGLASIEEAEEHNQKKSNAGSQPNLATDSKLAIPLWHTLKLCVIGQASSGKKTVAQMVKETYGDQIVVFNMNEVIREALNYVSVDKKEDQPDQAAAGKGAAAAKKGGKQAEAVVVDQFAGLNTTAYKEIASHLLKEVHVSTGQQKVPGQEVDLVHLIKDDNLMTSLFIEKLKLTFNQAPPTQQERETKMRETIEKEKELKTQLEELIQNEASTEVLGNAKDAKAKGKAPAKNQNAKTSKDVREEITQLLSVEKSGWVLVDFPRSINQAKLIEYHFNDFKSKTDQAKPINQVHFEVWSNFADPDFSSSNEIMFEAQNSVFDSVVLLKTDKDECLRRMQNRKIDPQTQSQYHMEDCPPPQNDAKLLDRLVPSFGHFQSEQELTTFLEQNHLVAADNEPVISQFYQEFGQLDQISGFGVPAMTQVVVQEKRDKQEVFEQVQRQLEKVFNYKQILQDREYQQLRVKVQQEEAEAAIRQADEVQKQNSNENVQNDDKCEEPIKVEHLRTQDDQQSQSNHHKMAASRLSEDRTSEQQSRKSKTTAYGLSKRTKRKDQTKDQKVELWDQMSSAYFRNGMLTIFAIKKLSEQVVQNLNKSQSDFIAFLERGDEKQALVNEFISNFNQFSQEFPDLRQDDQTKEELLSRVDILSNSLWTNIISKKDASLLEIQRMSESGWAIKEMRNACKLIAQMIEIEIKKFNTVFQVTLDEDPPVELDAEIMTKKLIERGVQAFDEKTKQSPVLNQMTAKLLHSIDELFIQAQREYNINENPLVVMLRDERKVFVYRIAQLQAWGLTLLEDIGTNSNEVYSLMDNWVVEAVSQENTNIQGVLANIVEFVKSNEMRMNEYDFNILPTVLDNHIQTKVFDMQTQALYIQRFAQPKFEIESCRFDLGDLSTLFEQIKKASGLEGHSNFLDQQTFINLMTNLYKQRKIPEMWSLQSFDKIQNALFRFKCIPLAPLSIGDNSPTQFTSDFTKSMGQNFSSTSDRSWMDWKKMFLYFVLLNSSIPTAEQIEMYEASLKVKSSEDGTITLGQFIEVPCWFDQFEGKPHSSLLQQWIHEIRQKQEESVYEDEVIPESSAYTRLDEDRLYEVKTLVFNTFRDRVGQNKLDTTELLETLRHISKFSRGATFADALFE